MEGHFLALEKGGRRTVVTFRDIQRAKAGFPGLALITFLSLADQKTHTFGKPRTTIFFSIALELPSRYVDSE